MDNLVAPGDVILGKYRVERVLGKGGMGVVVAARHVDLGQLYAIKFLLPAMLGHRDALERFLREARAASRLQSEHVARVHDVGRMDGGAPYMVMEYLDGCDLKAHLARQGPLPVEEAVAYVLQVCDAIAEAHELGIVHRDLKPANLFLVRRRNGSQSVKVLDFGISKHMGPEEVDLTSTNASFGSPLYMSPEQMARTKAVDARTDIWAMGAILYELLIGKAPFKAATMTEVVSRVLQEEPTPLRELRPEVPPGVEAVVMRCLRKRREERFSTVAELSAVLSPFMTVPSMRAPMGTGTNLGGLPPSDVSAIQGSTIPIRAPEPGTADSTTVAWSGTGTRAPKRTRPVWVASAVMASILLTMGGWVAWKGASVREVSPAASGALPSTEVAEPVVHVVPVPSPAPGREKGISGEAESKEPRPAPLPSTSAAKAKEALANPVSRTGTVAPRQAPASTVPAQPTSKRKSPGYDDY